MTVTGPEMTIETGRPGSTASRRRSPGRRLAAVGVLLTILFVVAGALWVRSYQPLSSVSGGYGAGLTAGGGYEAVVVDNAYGEERRIIAPAPGDEIGMLFPLDNGGPLGVTIVGIGQPFNPSGVVGGGIRVDETSAGRAMRATDASQQEWVDVTPFALPAGGYSQIRLTFDVLDCATEKLVGSVHTATTVPVTYRVLGLTRTADVSLGYAVSIESLPHCPY